MENGVILFQAGAQLPAYLRDTQMMEQLAAVNDDVSNFASYPHLSIKGKVWSVVSGDERRVLMKPAPNDDETAQFVEGVMIRINDKARTYYKDKYTGTAEAEAAKPTCYSNDGLTPSDLSAEKQSDKCATCPWSVFGTATDEKGNARKGTACSSNARIAFATVDALDKPYLLRAPAKSLKPLRDAVKIIRDRNLPYTVIMMKLGFVAEEASPMLTFRPIGVLDEAHAMQAIAMRDDSTVRAICGLDERTVPTTTPRHTPAPPPDEPSLAAELDKDIAAKAQAKVAADAQAAAAAARAAADKAAAEAAQAAAEAAEAAGAAAARQVEARARAAAEAAKAAANTASATPPAAESKVIVSSGDAGDPLAELNDLLGNLDG